MPAIEALFFFIFAACIANLCPGPSMIYVMSRSLRHGRSAGISSAFGLTAGLFFHVLATTLGLSAIFLYSPAIYTTIKFLGCAYLIYLGILTLKSSEPIQQTGETSAKSKINSKRYQFFNQGVLTEILNPKTSLFFLSFLPQFVDPSQGSTTLQLFIFGMILLFISFCRDILLAISSSSISSWLTTKPTIQCFQRWLTGFILIGVGIRLAVEDN